MRLFEVRAYSVVCAFRGYVEERVHPLDIEGPVLAEHRLFGLDVHDLSDKTGVEPQFERVKKPALKDKRELCHIGGIDKCASLRSETCSLPFVRISP